MPNKKLLIITGPQGSGNHLFSRIFSQHIDVKGWEKLKKQYWVPSDEETFAEYWVYPEKLTDHIFNGKSYFLANVSAPFFYDGVRCLPKIKEVAEKTQSLGIEVIIGIVTRDSQINRQQQERVGGEATLDSALKYYKDNLLDNFNCFFISNETFFSWKEQYIEYLGKLIDFPVDTSRSNQFIQQNPNSKYIQKIDNHWLDDVIRAGRKPFTERKEV